MDDFLFVGPRGELEKCYTDLRKEFEIKKEIVGPGVDEVSESKFLGRTIRWTRAGIEYEADSKHVHNLLQDWAMEGCKPVCSPGATAEDSSTQRKMRELDEKLLDGSRARAYRAAAARFNCLSLDRMDLAYSSKELSRKMASPSEADEVRLKRAVRYVQGRPRATHLFKWQDHRDDLVCQVDSDWAGCTRTRRSTSGGVIFRGGHVLGHWSRVKNPGNCGVELGRS